MLTVDKIHNNKTTFTSNKNYGFKLSSFGNNLDAQRAYLDMNKDIYVDFVDGDISLLGFLADKLKNYWHIVTNHNPNLELKARMIEENLKSRAHAELHYDRIA